MKSEWYVYGPDGTPVIEMANSAFEAAQRARKRPGFDVEDLRVEFKEQKPPAPVRSGKAAQWTSRWLREHQDWKRDDYA